MGITYSQFCERYRRGKKVLTPVLQIEHKSSGKMFVDCAGPAIPCIDRKTE